MPVKNMSRWEKATARPMPQLAWAGLLLFSWLGLGTAEKGKELGAGESFCTNSAFAVKLLHMLGGGGFDLFQSGGADHMFHPAGVLLGGLLRHQQNVDQVVFQQVVAAADLYGFPAAQIGEGNPPIGLLEKEAVRPELAREKPRALATSMERTGAPWTERSRIASR